MNLYTVLQSISTYTQRYEGEMRIAMGLIQMGLGLRIWAAIT